MSLHNHQIWSEGKAKILRPVASRKWYSWIRVGEYQSKSRSTVRGPHGAEEKRNTRMKDSGLVWLSHDLHACYYPQWCWTMGSLSTQPTDVLLMGEFPTGSRESGRRKWCFWAWGSESPAETAEVLNSSPLPPTVLRPAFCQLEGITCSLLTWEWFPLDLAALAAMT